MARSPLLGIDRPNPHAPGHDDLALGPSDSSDSGSDLAGLDAPDRADPDLPLDRALADDIDHPLGAPDARGNASDTAGTGERRSAAGDAGGPDGADIAVDRVFSPFGEGEGDGDDLPPVDELAVDDGDAEDGDDGESGDEGDDGQEGGDAAGAAARPRRAAARARRDAEEDEAADPVGDGAADAALAARMAHVPGRPNPEPDPPDDAPANPAPPDEPPAGDEPHKHQPGRDPGARRQG